MPSKKLPPKKRAASSSAASDVAAGRNATSDDSDRRESAETIAKGVLSALRESAQSDPAPEKPKRVKKPERQKKRRERIQGNVPSNIEVFFDERGGAYCYKVGGRYLTLSQTDLELHLRHDHGLSDEILAANGLSQMEWVRHNAQVNKCVSYAAPLAGHKVGNFMQGGERVLVTTQAQGVWDDLPKKARPEWFLRFVEELLPDGQAYFFLQWLARAVRELRRESRGPGQMVIFVGVARCGKSLMQDIITEVLGGRACNPFRYLTAGTQFNYDLAKAEHWKIADPKSTTDMKARREFGDMIKNSLERTLSIHAKGKDATLILPVMIRITLSINPEQDNIARIPPFDPSIAEKCFLFNCARVAEAYEQFRVVKGTRSLLVETRAEGELDSAALWQRVMSEIPAIRSFLMEMPLPKPDERDDRFGIKAWHHPKLLEELSSLNPWDRLLEIASEVLFAADHVGSWKGKASDLEKAIENSDYKFAAAKLFTHSGACGAHLSRLKDSRPERVKQHPKRDGYTLWEITQPVALGSTHNGTEE
jgi:hypothetical protein